MSPEFVTITAPPRPPPPVTAFNPALPPLLSAEMPTAFAPEVLIEPALLTVSAPPAPPPPPLLRNGTQSAPLPPVLVAAMPDALLVVIPTPVSVVMDKGDPGSPLGSVF